MTAPVIHVWTWRQAVLESPLPATSKLVATVLSTFMNDHGQGCYPSVKTVSRLASLSERAVCNHLETMAAAGWLRVRVHGLGGQGWKRHEYRAAFPASAALCREAPGWPSAAPEGTEPGSEGAERPSKTHLPSFRKSLNEDQSNSPAELSTELPSPPSPSPAVRMPHDALPPDWAEWARVDRNWGDAVVADVWAQFREYWKTGKGRSTRREDWTPTWRNWCRKENIRPVTSRPGRLPEVRANREQV